jgi:tetratricopeptide (TPR) repeat protein
MVTFVPQKPVLGEGGIGSGYSDDSFPFATAEALLRARIGGAETPWQRGLFLRSLYRRCLIDGPPAAAVALRSELLADPATAPDEDELAGLEDISPSLLPRAWAAYTRGDFAEAAALGERCLAGGHRPAYVLDLLGAVDLARDDLAAAERHLGEAVTLDPGLASVWLRLAQLRMGQNRFRDAEACVARSLERGRDDELQVHWALVALEEIEARGGNARHLAKVLASVREPLAGSANYHVAAAKVEHELGLHEQARQSLATALTLAPDHPVARQLVELWSPAPADPAPDHASERAGAGLPSRH